MPNTYSHRPFCNALDFVAPACSATPTPSALSTLQQCFWGPSIKKGKEICSIVSYLHPMEYPHDPSGWSTAPSSIPQVTMVPRLLLLCNWSTSIRLVQHHSHGCLPVLQDGSCCCSAQITFCRGNHLAPSPAHGPPCDISNQGL